MDYRILKHYVGCNVSITFDQHGESETLYGKIMSYDVEKMSVTIKESINYEVPFEKIENFFIKGFDELTEKDILKIVEEVHGFQDGWSISQISHNEILINRPQAIYVKDFVHGTSLKRSSDNAIVVSTEKDNRLSKPDKYGEVYYKLIEHGFLIG